MNLQPNEHPDFRSLFERAPDLYLVLTADLKIVGVSDAYCRATMTTRDGLLGRALFDAFPDNPDDTNADGVSNLSASLGRVLKFRRPDAMPVQKYDVPRPASDGGGFEERYWRPLNTPVLTGSGEVAWIIHRVEDVTELTQVRAEDAASRRLQDEQADTIAKLRRANLALMARNQHTAAPREDAGSEGSELEHQISERADTVEELRRTSTFLNLVIENIPAMVVVKDVKENRFVLVNRAGEEMTGLHRTLSIGKSDYDFFPKEQAEFFIARDREVMASGKLQVIPEEPIDTRYKGRRLLRTLKMPIPDEHGEPKYLLALSEDITERKETEAALQASEARFRSLLAASPDAVIVMDESSRILLASHRAEAMFGYAPEELVGKPFNILLSERDREDYSDRLLLFVQRPESYSTRIGGNVTARHKSGREFPTEIGLSAHLTPQGPTVIAAIRDVTDRTAVETQLRQAQKMEAIGNLTGGMAHDFNNLLAIIIGNLDILCDGRKVSGQAEELIHEALDAALRGADLTQRLLAFARRQPLQPQRTDVNELVTRTSKLLSRTLAENIEIAIDLRDNIWPIVVDPTQLEASLLNIANNARDAMPRGGLLTIATSNRHLDEDYAATHPGLSAGDYTMIEISDSGTGIPPDVLSRIFEPFFTTKEQGKGTGLGLSMVFGFIKQSGGHINVYSEPGVGTTFRLYMPRASGGSEAAESEGAVAPERGGYETILAVEDNGGLRRVVARQLKELGYRLLEAEDGPSALKILERERVDLLFSDVVMPGGMSGYDLAKDALARWPRMKVLLTSGFPETKINGNGGMTSTMRLLSKPYRKADLARMLREVLDA